MGRNLTNKAHKYFNYNQITNTSICTMCKISLTGKHATNLRRHLTRFHNFKESDFDDGSSSTVKNSGTKSKKISKNKNQLRINEINFIKVEMTRRDLENSCVELVTVNGRPFSILNDSGFLNIVNPIKRALEQTRKETFSISPESIKKKVVEEANNIRREILEEIKNTMVSIKIDAVTRLDRSFLGINMQYIKNSKILLRTLGLAELKEKHTGAYLTTIIRNICNRYNIHMDQVYTITTDNGANMLKAIKILSSDCSDSNEALLVEENKYVNINDDIDLDLLDLDELTEENEKNKTENHIENILQDIENSTLGSNFSSNILTGVRCAAHILQLVVDDVFKNADKGISSLIQKARRLVKKLRTQTFLYMLKKQNLKKPIIDCPTRWSSTVDMLERLLLLKDYCTELAVTKFEKFETLTDAEWVKIEKVCQILQPIKTCTEKLQAEQLTLSDFFSNWLETKLTMKKMNTPFAILIFEFMISREKHLLENNVLLSALFLDPRFKILLEEIQIEKAKTHLKHLWVKIMSLQENFITSNSDSQECPSSGSESTSDDFENFLKLKEIHHFGISRSSSSVQLQGHLSLQRIEVLLKNYNQEQKRISRKTNILEFWKENSITQPELYKLAMIVLAVPATQVSVERLFSSLKFGLSPLRTNINEAILEDQLLVRANRIFINKDDTKLTNSKRVLAMMQVDEAAAKKKKENPRSGTSHDS
ncbi:uncharacterized protein [Linepithema humile]|uniref:uncharacterized protein isoform X2 n=1 Tax=Linepithema humile TaxID=83485 RepID=UPI00351EA285